MIIVAGQLPVDPEAREQYLAECVEVMALARGAVPHLGHRSAVAAVDKVGSATAYFATLRQPAHDEERTHRWPRQTR